MGKRRIDQGTVLGVTIAGVCLLAGFWLEGGVILQILQPNAALIVLGGTTGAVLIQFPLRTVRQALWQVKDALVHREVSYREVLLDLERYCTQARRFGVLSLDARLESIEPAFLRKCLTLAVDAFPAHELRRTMEMELNHQDERDAGLVKVLEAAAGFAPTMGLIGAVLGLVQVMQRIADLGEIGKGIAVAFVSTLYGIGIANIIFLPLAGKVKIRLREQQHLREMMLEAVLSIVEGVSSREMKERLRSFEGGRDAIPATPAKASVELAAR